MLSERIRIKGFEIDCFSVNTLIIGSGTASLNAAISLSSFGQKDFVIVTEKWGGGTSNNAGSDKQTYYKVSLSGDEPDSPSLMARDLFSGKCMHGDIALCEAQGSLEAFMNLARLGVPFPQNKYGAFAGYKTDNDPRARGTSAGPYTSQKMFRVLASEVKRQRIKIFDRYQVIALLHSGKGEQRKINGAIAIRLKEKDFQKAFVVFNSVNVILGSGGPAGIYETSAYPVSQAGSTGIAFEAGVSGQNLTETQFGIASLKFNWNLSGSYQQVIPRYISTDKNGNDRREFLNDSFPDLRSLSRAIFLKGYQWPFSALHINGHGSSLIDLLVFYEMKVKKRRVFVDYSKNPTGASGEKFELEKLDAEVRGYLKRSGAEGPTPYARLASMNPAAIDVFLNKKTDLSKEFLEIAVCAQHNNGGLKGNIWWETDVSHLFAVGEVNGSHGVSRPGGAALNSGQVGSRRAALYISKKYNDRPEKLSGFLREAAEQIESRIHMAAYWKRSGRKSEIPFLLNVIRKRMSENGGIIRTREGIKKASEKAYQMLKGLNERISASTVKEIASGFRLVDHCLTHFLYIEAIRFYIEAGGRSRGSALIEVGEETLSDGGLEKGLRFAMCGYDRVIENKILEISFRDGKVHEKLTEVRQIPEQELWFETVWKKNLEDNLTEC